MDPVELHDFVIVPVLEYLGLDQPGASHLVLGTGLVESNLEHLRQARGGPALSFFQMEPATHEDHMEWLGRKPALRQRIFSLLAPWPKQPVMQLVTNLNYAVAMCRAHYWRRPERLPPYGDLDAYAMYWKKHYNTFQPEQSHEYVMVQLQRFTDRFPTELLDR
jgi:hypothetical protein